MTEVTLQLPKLDGRTAKRLMVSFLGAVELDRLHDVRLGQDVELVIVARCVAKGFATSTKHDDSDVAAYSVKVRVRELREIASST